MRDAVTMAQMARELFGTPWIKLEVIGIYPIVDSLAWVERLTCLDVCMVPLRAKNLAHEGAVRRRIHCARRQ